MDYLQKYCIVAFIEHIDVGSEFNVSDWPLHVTLADVFALDYRETRISRKLGNLLLKHPPLTIIAKYEDVLGNSRVTMLQKTKDLLTLHLDLVNLLESHGATFSTPEFTRDGFIPHCTIQKDKHLSVGQSYALDTISLIDMLPNNNWQQRKVLESYKLRARF